MDTIAITTLIVATVGTASTVLFRLQQERVRKRDELARWVDRALSLNGAWKWRGRMVGTEYELERVIAEAEVAKLLVARLKLQGGAEEIKHITAGLRSLKGKQGWDEEADRLVARIDGLRLRVARCSLWWPLL